MDNIRACVYNLKYQVDNISFHFSFCSGIHRLYINRGKIWKGKAVAPEGWSLCTRGKKRKTISEEEHFVLMFCRFWQNINCSSMCEFQSLVQLICSAHSLLSNSTLCYLRVVFQKVKIDINSLQSSSAVGVYHTYIRTHARTHTYMVFLTFLCL